MAYGITLFVDSETEQAIRTLWEKIVSLGFSAHVPNKSVRPHMTLAMYDDIDVNTFAMRFREFVGQLAPIPFTLASVGTFIQPAGTVFLSPTVTQDLINLHSYYQEYFHEYNKKQSAYSLPGRWTPHITLTQNIHPKHVGAVIQHALDAHLPVQSSVKEIAIGEVQFQERPGSYKIAWLHTFPLKTPKDNTLS